jgi:hypothetical protein
VGNLLAFAFCRPLWTDNPSRSGSAPPTAVPRSRRISPAPGAVGTLLKGNRPCTNGLCRTRTELGQAGPILIPRGGPRPWRSYRNAFSRRQQMRAHPRARKAWWRSSRGSQRIAGGATSAGGRARVPRPSVGCRVRSRARCPGGRGPASRRDPRSGGGLVRNATWRTAPLPLVSGDMSVRIVSALERPIWPTVPTGPQERVSRAQQARRRRRSALVAAVRRYPRLPAGAVGRRHRGSARQGQHHPCRHDTVQG